LTAAVHLAARDGLVCTVAAARPETTTQLTSVTCTRCARRINDARDDAVEAWRISRRRLAAESAGLGQIYAHVESEVDGAVKTMLLDLIGSLAHWLEETGYTVQEHGRED